MKLVVIIDDELPALVSKGEIIDRYYNPGNFFSDVMIYVMNNKKIDPSELKRTVGDAQLSIRYFNWNKKKFIMSLGMRPFLLKFLIKPVVEEIKRFNPDCIRCHDNNLNSYIAYRLKITTKTPYVISLHINRNEDIISRASTNKQKLINFLSKKVQRIGIENANLVLPVYKPILQYTDKFKIKNCIVSYNMINSNVTKRKETYNLDRKVRIVSVGRLIKEKNPINIIRALKEIPEAEFDIYGDGDMRDHLIDYVKSNNLSNRVRLIRAINNDKLVSKLRDYDIFAVHTEYWEISKSLLEALLVGMPIIINKRKGSPVPELTDDIVSLCENSMHSYSAALQKMINDNNFREDLGRNARKLAYKRWAPENTEKVFTKHYKDLIGGCYPI